MTIIRYRNEIFFRSKSGKNEVKYKRVARRDYKEKTKAIEWYVYDSYGKQYVKMQNTDDTSMLEKAYQDIKERSKLK